MRFQADHDLHMHSYISPCAGHDMRWTPQAILTYGIASGLKLVGITDHIWDKKVKTTCRTWADLGLDLEKGREILPLPQSKLCKMLFGIEVDMDYLGNIAVSKEEMDSFDLLVLSPSHMHMKGWQIDPNQIGESPQEHKQYYIERLNRFFDLDLPFEKCGLSHFTTCLTCTCDPIGMFRLFTDEEYREIFGKAAELGIGVELNLYEDWLGTPPEDWDELLRPYRIAKSVGCRFYFASDAHTPEEIVGKKAFWEELIDMLDLQESDKFPLIAKHLAEAGIE